MSVHKDKKRGTWFFVVRVDGKYIKRRNKLWTLKRHALEAERKFLSQYDDLNISLTEVTFKQLSDQYIDYLKLHRKVSTASKVSNIIKRHLLNFFGTRKIKKITGKNIENFQKSLVDKTYFSNGVETHYSNSHLFTIQNQLKLIFDYAVKHKQLTHNPFDSVEVAKRIEPEIKKDYRILTKQEFDTFLSVIENQVDRTLYSILYWCGLRIGEALALSIEDYKNDKLHVYKNYDLKHRILTTTKTSNTRFVDVPMECKKELDKLLLIYQDYAIKPTSALLGLETRLTGTTINRHKKQYIKEAGLKHFTFHDLRHTHVSTLIQLGARPIDISKRLGHGVEMVNNTYGHLFESDKENILNRLNDFGQQSGQQKP